VELTRRSIILVSAVLLAILTVGVSCLVRLASDASSGEVSTSPGVSHTTSPAGVDAPDASDSKGTGGLPGGRGDMEPTGGNGPTALPPGSAGHPPAGGNAPAIGPDGSSGTLFTSPTTPTSTSLSPPDDEGPPRPPTEISVSGVRIDGTIRNEKCGAFANEQFSVKVRVVDVQLVNFDPPNNGLLIDHGCGDANFDCRTDLPWLTTREERGQLADRGCRVGVVRGPDSPEIAKIGAEVRMRLVATCTSRSGEPCRQLDGSITPSPDNPIEVTWWDDTKVLLESWKAVSQPSDSAAPSELQTR
jgi:hypothetical protein